MTLMRKRVSLDAVGQHMNRTYEYRGYRLDVSVEALCFGQAGRTMLARRRYIAVVRFVAAHDATAEFPTMRLDEAGGQPFASEVDALMGGYSAGQRLIDDRLSRPPG
ncbi:hypothetical protein C7408_110128 [Paraburkholderia caballeronis]|uniref:Uncharacterized protein n=2 Tax=Paraburkholderia caballeronis TaxID=416943 RepID=A0A1H7T456_9BURK|nr:hypothetical protein C7403_113129 [Paraburkholderia caballeronis]PXW96838.1 hypothetical protein C7407_113129 [Paraburkholderia caballeronis]RAJ93465.1 hypothetical protein C7409_113129 [Paraburkholderia caballeronis]TDV12188.1 hypothetical protein C7408_110128 [Paraburkholderia caballeronis]TDV15263.1 hypothetical protein C7406_111128 [Paraburkholderia caballeronis]